MSSKNEIEDKDLLSRIFASITFDEPMTYRMTVRFPPSLKTAFNQLSDYIYGKTGERLTFSDFVHNACLQYVDSIQKSVKAYSRDKTTEAESLTHTPTET